MAVSYASGTSDIPLIGMTIGEKFDEIVSCFGDREAVVCIHQNIRMTYKELAARVNTVAKALLALGLNKGDRIGVWSPNNVEWLISQYASAKCGAILVTINPAYRVHELAYVLKQSGCKALIIQNQFKTSDYEAMLAEICPGIAACQPGSLQEKEFPNLRTVITTTRSRHSGIYGWDELQGLASHVSDQAYAQRQVELDMDEAINIQYTSGTTGFPKGATLSHHNILNNAFFTAKIMKFTEADRLIVPVPLYHCFGMVLANLGCLTTGACLVYPSEAFEPEAVLQATEQERGTALFGVPTMFIAELALDSFRNYNLTSLRTGIMAGAPCPVETMKQVIELMHMHEVEIGYGMTETSPLSFQTRTDAPFQKRVTTVGSVHPHVEVKIIDDNTGKLCPLGVMGELCTRGYSVMIGYWDNAKATNSSIDKDGWMHSGDIAVMDEDGYVNIVGRIKDMIIRGGENVYPKEIEEFLMTHDRVENVQVTGVPDEKYGEEIIAWIKLTAGPALTDQDIKAFCKGKLAHYKVPRYYRFTEEFPMTVTGKIQKFKMREISIGELGLKKPQAKL
ncbi:hypothetical protein CYMTET_50045 [Cymbomonas tetramitiformis]|uniref:AMP-binding protein n=1 Tax=Cymbomonas tetramitiformis TaxID=36881 RepID=A0AAE0BQL5_9CHLO|nr:hypothetical protein CYMTET_50045 [Cymbomonas tetramitiformis]|eukprot:gene25228-30793_t